MRSDCDVSTILHKSMIPKERNVVDELEQKQRRTIHRIYRPIYKHTIYLNVVPPSPYTI